MCDTDCICYKSDNLVNGWSATVQQSKQSNNFRYYFLWSNFSCEADIAEFKVDLKLCSGYNYIYGYVSRQENKIYSLIQFRAPVRISQIRKCFKDANIGSIYIIGTPTHLLVDRLKQSVEAHVDESSDYFRFFSKPNTRPDSENNDVWRMIVNKKIQNVNEALDLLAEYSPKEYVISGEKLHKALKRHYNSDDRVISNKKLKKYSLSAFTA